MKAPQYLLLVITGLAAIYWGLPAAHSYTPPRSLLASLSVLLGVVMLLTGALLTVLPDFFYE